MGKITTSKSNVVSLTEDVILSTADVLSSVAARLLYMTVSMNPVWHVLVSRLKVVCSC